MTDNTEVTNNTERPLPDGSLSIKYYHKAPVRIFFKDMLSWSIREGCLWIERQESREVTPLTTIAGVQVIKNSPEVVKAIIEWRIKNKSSLEINTPAEYLEM